jgi:hypothetical protein
VPNGPLGDIMIKRDKNFRMAKQIKRQLAVLFQPFRSQYKNLMISAQISSAIVPKDKKKKEAEKEN